jgi:hypothetical protein
VLAPAWIADGLAITMLTVSAYCASRVIVARRLHRRTNYSVDAVHTVMGIAMAGMLTSRLASPSIWVVVFAVATGWFGVRAVAGATGLRASSVAVGSHVRHLITSGAMVYMLLATPAAAAASTPNTTTALATMGSNGQVRFPTLALLLGFFMIGYTVMVADRLSRTPSTCEETSSAVAVLAPRTVACCQVAMNVTMGYMLVTLL